MLDSDPIRGEETLQLLPPRFMLLNLILISPVVGVSQRDLRLFEVLSELGVGVVEEKVVVNERLSRDDAEHVDEPLGGVADVAANDVAAGGGVEDGEVDVGVGVGGVEEAAEADGVLGVPELEDLVDVDEVVEEAAVLVPALPGSHGAQHRDQRRKLGVHALQLPA